MKKILFYIFLFTSLFSLAQDRDSTQFQALECKFLEADFKIPAEEYYCIDYGIILGERSIYCLEGFSEKGKSSLISFCEELKMPFCVRE